jgi:hypothetical protein
MTDWLIDHIGWILAAFVVLLLGGMALLIASAGRAEAEFMKDCTAERPKYECTAMWRAGDSHMVPVIIPTYGT